MSEIDYKKKYLKYKQKYLKLKAGSIFGVIKGVYDTTTSAANVINPFSNKNIAEKVIDLHDGIQSVGTMGIYQRDWNKSCPEVFKDESTCNKITYCEWRYNKCQAKL